MNDLREESADQQMVCGRKIAVDQRTCKCAEHQGRKIYFCTRFCLEAYLSDPERFYSAHSKKRGG
jgi:YHS domain-containing protein